jgi:hypothetical protein
MICLVKNAKQIIMNHRIAIIKYKDYSGAIRYRSFSHPNPNASTNEIIRQVFWTIGYQQEYPKDNTIYDGQLHETSIRLCVLSPLERQQGVRICLKEDGSIIISYPVGSTEPIPQEVATIHEIHHMFLDI